MQQLEGARANLSLTETKYLESLENGAQLGAQVVFRIRRLQAEAFANTARTWMPVHRSFSNLLDKNGLGSFLGIDRQPAPQLRR